jgi:hypothetical protein
MTEQTPQPEVLGGTEEQKGRPTPEVSEVSAAVTPSSQQVDTDALAAKLADVILPKFEEQARKRAQSVFDKTSYQFETMAEYLKAAGGDPRKAAREMALDQVAQREMVRQTSEPEVPGRTKGEDDETRTARFLNDLKDESGVELSDEELARIWGGKRYTNWDDAFKDAKKAAWKKAKGESIGAGAVVTEAGATASTDDVEDLAKELNQLQKGNISDPNNKKRRAEIKAKLAAQRG